MASRCRRDGVRPERPLGVALPTALASLLCGGSVLALAVSGTAMLGGGLAKGDPGQPGGKGGTGAQGTLFAAGLRPPAGVISPSRPARSQQTPPQQTPPQTLTPADPGDVTVGEARIALPAVPVVFVQRLHPPKTTTVTARRQPTRQPTSQPAATEHPAQVVAAGEHPVTVADGQDGAGPCEQPEQSEQLDQTRQPDGDNPDGDNPDGDNPDGADDAQPDTERHHHHDHRHPHS